MKRLFTLWLTALLFCVSTPGIASGTFFVNGLYYHYVSIEDEVVTVYPNNQYSGNISIPSTVIYNNRTYLVIGIDDECFHHCLDLTCVKIPNGVKSIGKEAFVGCTGLTSIEIPNSVTSIGKDAFKDTKWYNNQPDGLVYAGKVAYKYKGDMPANTSIVFNDGTCRNSKWSFLGMQKLNKHRDTEQCEKYWC